MNRFHNRVKRLMTKNGDFIPRADFQLIFDYQKALLDDAGIKPNDYADQCDEIRKLITKEINENYSEVVRQLGEMFECDRKLHLVWKYLRAKQRVIDFPNGEWLSKRHGKFFSELRREAQEYFKAKDERN